jgi:Protein of unknown function (DUF3750)
LENPGHFEVTDSVPFGEAVPISTMTQNNLPELDRSSQMPANSSRGQRAAYERPLKFVARFVFLFFVLPLCIRAALFVFEGQTPDAYSFDTEKADMSSIGLLPAATNHPAARVLIMSVPLAGDRGKFFTHSWIVLKRENARSWSRYEVLGYASRDADGTRNGRWLGGSPMLNGYTPDGRWFGRIPVPLVDIEGATAAAMIPKIEAVVENYEAMVGRYRFWPGPNSNTFVATVLRAMPELGISLPPTAIGKDFRPGVFVGLTDSRTGVEADLWGILGLKIGWVEGVEINLLSAVAGFDLRQPALKLPGFGRIEGRR